MSPKLCFQPNKRRRVVKQEYDPMSFMDDSGSSESEGELGTIEDLLVRVLMSLCRFFLCNLTSVVV